MTNASRFCEWLHPPSGTQFQLYYTHLYDDQGDGNMLGISFDGVFCQHQKDTHWSMVPLNHRTSQGSLDLEACVREFLPAEKPGDDKEESPVVKKKRKQM